MSVTGQKDTRQATAPSMAKIAAATGIALVAASIILVVAVLPAEYGIDPLGTGKALGLTELARASATPAAGKAEGTIVPVLEPSPTGDAPTVKGTFIPQPGRYNIDSREMKLKPHEGMEIKYNMMKGAGFVYSWTTSKPVLFEFHGEPDKKPEGRGGTDYYESYELDDKVGKDHSNGTFIAPSTGIHGWFWENKSDDEVTLKLVTAGFYEWIVEHRNDKFRTLTVMDVSSVPGHPQIPDCTLKFGVKDKCD
jgi:hypothetical protein